MDLLQQYADKVTLGLFVHLNNQDVNNFKVIRARVYELILEEVEQLITDHLKIPQMKAKFIRKLEQAVEREDEAAYEELILTYLQLVPDMALLLDRRMNALEVNINARLGVY